MTTPDVPPPIPGAPPILPGPITMGPRPSAWPTVIGIIAIVVGALSALGHAMAFAQPLVFDMMAGFAPDQSKAQFDVQRRWMATTMPLAGVNVLLAILLLIAGITLVTRRRAGVQVARVWAVLKMLAVVALAYINYLIQVETIQAMADAGQSFPGAAFMTGPIALVGAVLGLAWGWALPLFILIWFSVPSVRREVGTWK